MGEKWLIQFCLQHATSTVSVGIFYMPTWDRRLYFPSEGRHAEDFFARKIRRLQPGLNPRTWVPEASTLTTRALIYWLLTNRHLRITFAVAITYVTLSFHNNVGHKVRVCRSTKPDFSMIIILEKTVAYYCVELEREIK
jgi:hypothetical protein